jgi:uracil-DNA glycosylase
VSDASKKPHARRRPRSEGDARAYAALVLEARACDLCAAHLPFAPKPIFAAAPSARLAIVGQAPGRVAHETGVPWNDRSGERLRRLIGVDAATFYDATKVALLPMGFCFPGSGKTGDLPPRPECAETWQARFFAATPSIRLTLLVGRFAQSFHLRERAKATTTATVFAFRDYLPRFFPIPHPSPRNRFRFERDPTFERDVLPALRAEVARALAP